MSYKCWRPPCLVYKLNTRWQHFSFIGSLEPSGSNKSVRSKCEDEEKNSVKFDAVLVLKQIDVFTKDIKKSVIVHFCSICADFSEFLLLFVQSFLVDEL